MKNGGVVGGVAGCCCSRGETCALPPFHQPDLVPENNAHRLGLPSVGLSPLSSLCVDPQSRLELVLSPPPPPPPSPPLPHSPPSPPHCAAKLCKQTKAE